MSARPDRRFYQRDPLALAPALLNLLLVVADGRAGRIVEVEAYRGSDDPGSHAARGRSPRNATMWGPAGHLYVYFTYGMHWCANVVGAGDGVAGAVLVRAVWPVGAVEAMREARRAHNHKVGDADVGRGPARTCQALGIGPGHDGADLVTGDRGVWLAEDGTPPPDHPATGPRVGLSAGADLPWRFWVPGHAGVSAWRPGRPRRQAPGSAAPPGSCAAPG